MARRIEPSRRRLRPHDWPRADSEAWQAALKGGDPFAGVGLASHWREGTCRKVSRAYGRWILFLRERDWLIDDEGPAERAQLERLRAYLAHLRDQDLSPVTITGLFTDLREALRVMAPGADLSLLAHAMAVLGANAKARRDKTQKYLRPEDAVRIALAHLETAAADAGQSRRGAARVRSALQLVFLIMRPLRRENFIGLRLGHDTVRLAPTVWRIQLPAQATKNGHPYEVTLPDLLGAWLERYLAEWRPRLLAGRISDRLWVSQEHTDMTGDGLYGELRKLTLKLFGKALNPHAFRDGPATALAIEAPAHIGAASAILGHSDPRTAERHYNLARTVEAAEAWQKAISEHRKAITQGARPRRSRTATGSRQR